MKTISALATALWASSSALLAGEPEGDFDARVRAFILDNPEVVVEALEFYAEREARAETRRRIAAWPGLFTDAPRHGLGAPDAPIRVVEFFDYKCQPCKAVHPALNSLVAKHPELRIEMRHLPILTPGSERAARFALAVQEVAGAEVHARVHERLWEMSGPLNAGRFQRIAEDEGLDYGVIAHVMESGGVSARIDQNRDIAIDLGIRGTPAFVTPDHVAFGSGDVAALADIWLSR